VNRTLPPEAIAFAQATRSAMSRLGGVEMARRAEQAPELRRLEVEPALRELGLLDLAPLTDEVEAIAAAMAIREAGAVVCPWPLVAVVGCDVRGADALYVSAGAPARLEHLDLAGDAVAVTAHRALVSVTADGPIAPTPLDPFGSRCLAVAREAAGVADGHLALLLGAQWIFGALSTVTTLSIAYSRERQQFGRPIGDFGAVRWRLADMAVARAGLEELATFTLWRYVSGLMTAADVLALRVYALEAAETILTHGHQVFAAIGLCDEHDMSIIDRHLQPVLRRPAGLAAAEQALAAALASDGFDALFPLEPLPQAAAVE
jgi:hypothetical protein